MKVNDPDSTVQVSFRLPMDLVHRMRQIASEPRWPPPPSQTEIVERGIRIVLDNLEPPTKRKRGKVRASA
jgi:hypothetical protein